MFDIIPLWKIDFSSAYNLPMSQQPARSRAPRLGTATRGAAAARRNEIQNMAFRSLSKGLAMKMDLLLFFCYFPRDDAGGDLRARQLTPSGTWRREARTRPGPSGGRVHSAAARRGPRHFPRGGVMAAVRGKMAAATGRPDGPAGAARGWECGKARGAASGGRPRRCARAGRAGRAGDGQAASAGSRNCARRLKMDNSSN